MPGKGEEDLLEMLSVEVCVYKELGVLILPLWLNGSLS